VTLAINYSGHKIVWQSSLLPVLSVLVISGVKMYRTTVVPVVLYECKTWSLTLREDRVKGFQNRVLRKIEGESNRRLEKTAS
jgi:hypothetical protein